MRRIGERLAKLEATANHADGKGALRVFLLDAAEALPDGVSADDEDVMVIRLVSPVHDAGGLVVPCQT
jgi:hypothetical protein